MTCTLSRKVENSPIPSLYIHFVYTSTSPSVITAVGVLSSLWSFGLCLVCWERLVMEGLVVESSIALSREGAVALP